MGTRTPQSGLRQSGAPRNFPTAAAAAEEEERLQEGAEVIEAPARCSAVQVAALDDCLGSCAFGCVASAAAVLGDCVVPAVPTTSFVVSDEVVSAAEKLRSQCAVLLLL